MIQVCSEEELVKETGEMNTYIYGAGMVGNLVVNRIRSLSNSFRYSLHLEGFLKSKEDDDIVHMNGLAIFYLCKDIAERLYDSCVILGVTASKQPELLRNLQKYDIKKIICITDDCIKEMLVNQNSDISLLQRRIDELEMSYIRMIPKPAINVSFHLTDECNLNCKGCWHFAPLAKRNAGFADIDEFERDVSRLAEIMQGEITLFSLFGGEPLLHPEAYRFPYIIKKYLPDTFVEILSNGLLIPKQEERFWNSCRENDVCLEWTRYPIGEKQNELIERSLRNAGIKYRIFNGAEAKCLTHDVIDLLAIGDNGQRGRNDARYQWLHCFRAGDCVQLKNHRLYACDKAANAPIFKEYFNLDIRCSAYDGIDIYEAKSKDEITKFLAKPIPFCRYCKVDQTTEGHKWTVSQREIDEWI